MRARGPFCRGGQIFFFQKKVNTKRGKVTKCHADVVPLRGPTYAFKKWWAKLTPPPGKIGLKRLFSP